MQIVNDTAKIRGFQAMVPMRDGTRLNSPRRGICRSPVNLLTWVRHRRSRASGTESSPDSLLEGNGFELVVPRCVVGGRLADAIAENAASSRLRRATALVRDDKSKMPRNPRRVPI